MDGYLRKLIITTDLLYYLAPSTITRLLHAVRMSRQNADIHPGTAKGIWIMSTIRELVGPENQFNLLLEGGQEVQIWGDDLDTLDRYIWNPYMNLLSVLDVWVIVTSTTPKLDEFPVGKCLDVIQMSYTNTLRCVDVEWHLLGCNADPCTCSYIGYV